MTDSVATCVAVILHDPNQKKGCLSHIDTDVFGESFEKRSPFLIQAIETMVLKLGSQASDLNLYALGGSGWFDDEAFKEACSGKFAKVMVVSKARLNNKKILYDPYGSPPVKYGSYDVTQEERSTSYENDVTDYEDRGLLFQVSFGSKESYEQVLSVDPEDF